MWITSELHCHTIHSDGHFTVNELVKTATEDGLQCIALTDHNTNSGCQELTPELIERYIPVIHGFEWTTYFGHMVVLNSKKYVDWRFATPDNIDDMMKQVKNNGGVIGVAHPFRPGSPFCTGCHWDFKLQDWNLPDYIEISSGSDPFDDCYNRKAYEFWLSKLDMGIHLAISHGKDWHRKDATRQLDGFTLLDIGDSQISPQSALNAIKCGRTVISVGATISMTAINEGHTYMIGDTMPKGITQIHIDTSLDTTRSHITNQFDIQIKTVQLISTGGTVIHTFNIADAQTDVEIDITGEYIFAKVLGTARHKETTIAITSPIYIKD